MGRLEIACVSYWEWAKLIATAILMALAIDGLGLAVWWLIK
jgi:hypothetical protein